MANYVQGEIKKIVLNSLSVQKILSTLEHQKTR